MKMKTIFITSKEQMMKQNTSGLSKNQKIILESFRDYSVHPTAQQLYAYVHQLYPKMGLTTVYRALNALVKAGKLQKITGIEDKIHYDHRLDLHPHFICKNCKTIMDIDKDCCFICVKKIEHKMKVSCDSLEMNIQGVCSKCRLEK